MGRMRRTQVYLEPELTEALDRLAERRGTSRASLLREAARALVNREGLNSNGEQAVGAAHGSDHGQAKGEEKDDFSGVTSILDLAGIGASRPTDVELDPERVTSMLDLVGAGHGEPGNVSENHDAYLIEAELAKWKRK